MEFIELDKNRYMVKDSNNLVVSKEEKLKLEKKDLIIKDITSNECQGETTQKIEEIDKELGNGSPIKETKKTTKRHNIKK